MQKRVTLCMIVFLLCLASLSVAARPCFFRTNEHAVVGDWAGIDHGGSEGLLPCDDVQKGGDSSTSVGNSRAVWPGKFESGSKGVFYPPAGPNPESNLAITGHGASQSAAMVQDIWGSGFGSSGDYMVDAVDVLPTLPIVREEESNPGSGIDVTIEIDVLNALPLLPPAATTNSAEDTLFITFIPQEITSRSENLAQQLFASRELMT